LGWTAIIDMQSRMKLSNLPLQTNKFKGVPGTCGPTNSLTSEDRQNSTPIYCKSAVCHTEK